MATRQRPSPLNDKAQIAIVVPLQGSSRSGCTGSVRRGSLQISPTAEFQSACKCSHVNNEDPCRSLLTRDITYLAVGDSCHTMSSGVAMHITRICHSDQPNNDRSALCRGGAYHVAPARRPAASLLMHSVPCFSQVCISEAFQRISAGVDFSIGMFSAYPIEPI